LNAASKTTRRLVDRWCNYNNRFPGSWDQRTLSVVLRQEPGLRIAFLPPELCWIDGGRKPDISERFYGPRSPAIIHTQASRRYKKIQNQTKVLGYVQSPFANYKECFKGGTIWIVGKGPTDFDYKELSKVGDPVVFINDSIQLAAYAGKSEMRFWFAHDHCQLHWLTGFPPGVTLVIPSGRTRDIVGNRMISFENLPRPPLGEERVVVSYNWNVRRWLKYPDEVKNMSREELAQCRELFMHSGTIHSVIHFSWFMGIKLIKFVGCEGVVRKTCDSRIELGSGCKPSMSYPKIRRIQDWLCAALGMATEYMGNPILEIK
jgi:hypothetical protein